MKTRINQIALFTLFVLFFLAGSVKAEGTERTNASSHEMIVEPALELEAWMVDNNNWVKSNIYNVQFEESLIVEDWMINAPMFENNTISVSEENESELELESWMINANIWD